MIESITAEWRHIPGYEGLYMASNLGEVMRLRRAGKNLLTGGESIFPSIVLKSKIGNSGYFEIQLTDRNGNKKHNEVSNLELVTPRENTVHAIVTGLRRPRKLTAEQVSELFLDYEHGMKRVELAFKYHVHIDTIDKWLKDYKKGKTEWLER